MHKNVQPIKIKLQNNTTNQFYKKIHLLADNII